MSARGVEKLRTLFAQEAEQRLGRLGQLVLELEATASGEPTDPELIHEIFREVHTLKGSAAVVGFEVVGHYAHGVEDKLDQLRSGAVASTPEIVDALLAAVDRLGVLIGESVDGDDVDDEANTEMLARLDAAFDQSAAIETPPAQTAPAESRQPAAPDPEPLRAEPPRLDPLLTATPPAAAMLRAVRAGASGRDAAGTVMVPIERIDELVRMVGEAAAAHLRVGRVLTDRLGVEPESLAEFSDLARVLNDLQEGAMRTRMVPVSTVTDQLQHVVRDTARSLGKDVRWEVRGESTELDRGVLHRLSDSLLHVVRNAVDHGIESPEARLAAGKPAQATVRLHAMQLGSEVIIAVSDDGGGINLDSVRRQAARVGVETDGLDDDEVLQLIFRSGFSTSTFVTDISGRGVGLDAVRIIVDAAHGRIEVRSTPGQGSEFRIVVPITLAVLRCLLVEAGGQRFALPLHRVSLVLAMDSADEQHAEGRRMLVLDGMPIPVTDLCEVLDLTATHAGPGIFVIVNGTGGRHAFLVDDLVGQRDVVVKGLSALVPRLDVVAGASVEPDGSILLVLDPPGLIERSRRNGSRTIETNRPVIAARRSGRLLVVDDALTVRELQRTILERAGFDVTVACDGVEALDALGADHFDLVLTDVEMPRMDGFTLTERIRAHPAHGNVAILILTSLASDNDRRRGMDAGADGYIVKSAFDEQSLLAAVDRLIGAPGVKVTARQSVRVVVVEDSLVQRAHLIDVLEADGDITVIGQASNAVEAIDVVAALRPQVVTMDLQIPDGGGQYAIEQIMANTPTPVLVLSASVQSDRSASAVEALVGGALMAVPKPARWTPELENELRRSVRTIKNVPVIRHIRGRLRTQAATAPPTIAAKSTRRGTGTESCVVAIAASTGGPPALATVLAGLGDVNGPVLIVQHIHPDFVQGLLDWMARVSPLPVVLARHGQVLRDGCVHIGPGGQHLRIGSNRTIELVERPLTAHRPSADQLFESVARNAGANSVGVLLTGMGEDGATGLLSMRHSGAHTIAQDQATSAVYGMPRAAKRLGAVCQELPIGSIAAAIRAAASRVGAHP